MKARLVVFLMLAPSLALACFGAELKIGVGKERGWAFVSYALGYFVEEKTGIEPLFIDAESAEKALAEKKIDLALLPAQAPPPDGAIKQETVKTPAGEAVIWLSPSVTEDIRFTTLARTLKIAGGFLSSKALSEAASQSGDPKKAARKAALDAQ